MLTISGWRGLEQFGINALTGEACAYSMRLACDVNEEGKRLLESFFGVGLHLAPNWNSKVDGKDAVGSIMLSRDQFSILARFALFQSGCKYVFESSSGSMHLTGYSEAECAKYEEVKDVPGYHVWTNYASSDPSISRGGRNIHQATGRER